LSSDGRDIPNDVVLPLVSLFAVEARVRGIEDVRSEPHRQQPVWIIEVEHLGSGDGGVKLGRSMNQRSECVRAGLNAFSYDPQVTRIDGCINSAPDIGDPPSIVLSGNTARVAVSSDHDHPLWSVHLPADRFNGGWKICTAARENRDRDRSGGCTLRR